MSEFTLDIGFCDPYPVIDFPLNVTKFWGLPACNLTLDGQIQTQIFDKLDRWNDIIRRPLISRIIEFILNLTGMGDLLEIIHMVSDILDDILPILDIGYVLEEYLGVEEILVQPIPPIFVVTNCSETVTVPAGTFDVCNISVANLSSMYYAPDVKSFVKITGNFEDILPFVNNVEAVLISYELH